MAQTADQLVERLFADQFTARRPVDPLARAFEDALARGGFELIGTVVPTYVVEMRRYWQEQRASGVQTRRETPTSPHLLARRQRLGRIETPGLVLRLPGRPLDEAFTRETAERFRYALNDIYRTGLARHQAAAAARE
jgi:hypothetical protein